MMRFVIYNNQMKNNEYQCAHCKGVFEKGWSDDEALKEAEVNFGKPVSKWKDIPVLVCDDCYNLMLPSEHPAEVEEAKKHL